MCGLKLPIIKTNHTKLRYKKALPGREGPNVTLGDAQAFGLRSLSKQHGLPVAYYNDGKLANKTEYQAGGERLHRVRSSRCTKQSV